jgi:hypothetical protein
VTLGFCAIPGTNLCRCPYWLGFKNLLVRG